MSEMIPVDIPVEKQRELIRIFGDQYLTKCSSELFTYELEQTGDIKEALFRACMNEVIIDALKKMYFSNKQPTLYSD